MSTDYICDHYSLYKKSPRLARFRLARGYFFSWNQLRALSEGRLCLFVCLFKELFYHLFWFVVAFVSVFVFAFFNSTTRSQMLTNESESDNYRFIYSRMECKPSIQFGTCDFKVFTLTDEREGSEAASASSDEAVKLHLLVFVSERM